LAYDVINDLIAKGELLGDPIHAQANFRKGIEKGLLKFSQKWGFQQLRLIVVVSCLKQLVYLESCG
jgi:hypothetical protein